jgi:hypothetical protein
MLVNQQNRISEKTLPQLNATIMSMNPVGTPEPPAKGEVGAPFPMEGVEGMISQVNDRTSWPRGAGSKRRHPALACR